MGNFSAAPTQRASENPGRERDLLLKSKKKAIKRDQAELKALAQKDPEPTISPEVETAVPRTLDILA
jgi:hypothetical protein